MGCSGSKELAKRKEAYALQLQNPRVTTAFELLNIDRRDAGLRFYLLFASIDTDDSNSIDLSELLSHLGLPRSPFAEQILSNLGRQEMERNMTFDDFVLNVWSFCTMNQQDLMSYVFSMYDDDGNGVLDTAEVESLLRFIYQTEKLSPKVSDMLKAADTDHNKLISRDEFFKLCKDNRDLLAPVFALQTRTQQKCFGVSYWAKESKKRPALLGTSDDVIAAFDKKFGDNTQALSGSMNHKENQKVNDVESVDNQVMEIAKTDHPSASARLAKRQQAQQLKELNDWIEAQRKDSVVDAYLTAYCQKAQVDAQLEKKKSIAPDAVEILTQLRHSAAVNAQRLSTAHSVLKGKWDEEERAVVVKRHATIKSMVKGISAKTLLQQTGKSGAGAVVGDYLQKKLDNAESDVRREFQERWNTLEQAAKHLATKNVPDEPLDERERQNPFVAKKIFAGEESGRRNSSAAEYTKVVPIAETWTQCFDEATQSTYYVSSLGNSAWEPPSGLHH